MTISIGRICKSAMRAALRSMPGINLDNLKAQSLSLIAEEAFELIEGPSVEVGPLGLAEFPAISDSVKLLNRNRRIPGSLCELNDSLADNMICITGKTLLSTGQPFQRTSDASGLALCLLPLEVGANSEVAVADVFGMLTAKEAGAFAIGSHGNIVDAPVNTDDSIVGVFNRSNFLLEGDRQIHLPFTDEKAGVPHLPGFEIFGKIGSVVISDTLNASGKGPHAQSRLGEREVPAPDPTLEHDSVVGEADGLSGKLLGCAQGSVFTGDVPDSAYRDLCREVEPGTENLIGKGLKANGIGDTAMLEGDLRSIVASIRPGLNGLPSDIEVEVNF